MTQIHITVDPCSPLTVQDCPAPVPASVPEIDVTQPQGRLSLVADCAIPVSDIVAATTLFYVPSTGVRVPIWTGTKFVMQEFGGLSLPLNAAWQTVSPNGYDVFCFIDDGVLRLGHGPTWASKFARGTGAGSTDIDLKSAIWVNKNPITLRWGTAAGNTTTVPAFQATYLGTFVCDVAGTITSSRKQRNLFNAYNQASLPIRLAGPTTQITWNYSTNAWRIANNDGSYFVAVCMGLPTSIKLSAKSSFVSSTSTFRLGAVALGVDGATPYPGGQVTFAWANNNGARAYSTAEIDEILAMGWHVVQFMEFGAGTDVQTWTYGAPDGIIGSTWI